ncbi:FtsX-like permease family protein [Staphylococcus lutrae]|uniref:Bacitracin ABC transporter permease n=1 Tax=Staphylococcus lutrae TaxID=155085 RepID=A0AAC9RRV1_9STAP|nr:ABC transporter permease [Staphylococcus lutrae]ARJ51208.1 bacitracin ABC transporter permease [Staphylococcus lutrae]PNZ39453.1 ABC transporter permease [Staphylococcus lutrae]
MSFSCIIFKNFKQNLKHYGLYLFSLILSIALYFSFVTLKYTKDVTDTESAALLNKSAGIGEVFLFIIIVIFLLYANHLFIRRRTKSFALFQLIGLSRKDLMCMIILEQGLIFLSITVLSFLLGVFGSRFLLLIVKKVTNIPLDIRILFEPAAMIVTIALVVCAYILIVLQSFIFIKRRSIIRMMYDVQQSESTYPQMTKRDVIFGGLGIVMIGLGYYFSTLLIAKVANLVLFFMLVFSILFLTVVGAYFFFRSSVSLIFKTLKQVKRGHINVTDVIFTASIMHRMKKNAFSLTIIGVISAITISLLSFAMIGKANIENNVSAMSPYEFTYINEADAVKKFESQLKAHDIAYHKHTQDVIRVPIFHSTEKLNQDVSDIPITSDAQFSDIDVQEGEMVFVNSFSLTESILGFEQGMILDLGYKNTHIPLKIEEISKENRFSTLLTFGVPIAVIDNQSFERLKDTKIKDKARHPIATQVGFDLNDKKDLKVVERWNQQLNKGLPDSHTALLKEQFTYSGMFLFVSGFLGITFLIAAGCIIYIKQMDENEDEMVNYQILRKMGYTHSDMVKGIALKISFNFGLPLLIGLGHAYFAARAFNTLVGGVNFIPVFLAMGAYVGVYIMFAVFAYFHSRRVIKFSI